MSQLKPHIVIVPGAWQTPCMFETFVTHLGAHGYSTTVVKLPSVDPPQPLTSIDEDILAVQQTLLPLIEAGKDVVLVMHSYGSIPGSEAVKGLAKADQEKDEDGGVISLVYMAGFLLRKGQTLLDAKAEPTLWNELDSESQLLTVPDPHTTFYNDLPDPPALYLSPYNVPEVYPKQSPAVFGVKITYEAWKYIPSTLIFPQQDNATPLSDTRRMIEGTDEKVEVVECAGSHSPWLSAPDLVLETVRRAAGEKVSYFGYNPVMLTAKDPTEMFKFLKLPVAPGAPVTPDFYDPNWPGWGGWRTPNSLY